MPLVSLRTALLGLGQGSPDGSIHGTETSGPRGIESIIEYNGLYLNVRNWIDTFLVTTILGIDDADVRDTREPNPGQHGETPGVALYGGRTVVLQGKLIAKTLWKMRDMEQAIRSAFGDLSQERPLTFHGTKPEEDLLIWCKKSQKLELPDTQTTLNHFERVFSITLRAGNPRFRSVLTRHYSWVYDGSSSVNAIIFQAANTGNAEAQPILKLQGPMTTPALVNETNNDLIGFVSNIPVGETWVIDMKPPAKVYRESDGADRWSAVDPLSTDFLYDATDLNQIRFTATGLTSASTLSSYSEDTYM